MKNKLVLCWPKRLKKPPENHAAIVEKGVNINIHTKVLAYERH